MPKIFLVITLLFFALNNNAQLQITGYVMDAKKGIIKNASVTIKNTYDGASTDTSGYFVVNTLEKDNLILTASAIGYEEEEKNIISLHKGLKVTFFLKEKVNALNAVTVTAGAFGGGQGKKSVIVLSVLDVQTTAGSNADISKAVNTLPGAQQIGNQEGLFVRGGDSYEAKQFIDGALVNNPYYLGANNIASRGKYSATLFKGFSFSTGGYSALYGQALSSILTMETVDLPERSEANAFISPIQNSMGIQHLAINKKSSWGANYQYTNTKFYYAAIKQTPDYFQMPQFHNADVNFRIKTKNGIIKYYTAFSYNQLGIRTPNLDSITTKNAISLNNYNWFNTISWKEQLGKGWKMNLIGAYSLNKDDINSALQNANNITHHSLKPWLTAVNFTLKRTDYVAQAKTIIEKKLTGLSALRFGAEYLYSKTTTHYNEMVNILPDKLSAAFAETDIYFSNALVLNLGTRIEYSSLIKKSNIAPRLSIAYKFGKANSISAAYGEFYQKPENTYLQYKKTLGYTKANHYLINYQKRGQETFLRIEIFYKKYTDLIKTLPNYNNNGYGYGKGAELYWRDKKTFKSINYTLSYSYLDTKRNYLNFPIELTPNFAAKHTATISTKRFFNSLKTGISITYVFASGRPYYNFIADSSKTMYYLADKGKTKQYQTADMSVYYLTTIGKASAICYASCTNILGINNVYGYNYSYNGLIKQPINPPAIRFYFIGVILNWGVDRRQNTIDNL